MPKNKKVKEKKDRFPINNDVPYRRVEWLSLSALANFMGEFTKDDMKSKVWEFFFWLDKKSKGIKAEEFSKCCGALKGTITTHTSCLIAKNGINPNLYKNISCGCLRKEEICSKCGKPFEPKPQEGKEKCQVEIPSFNDDGTEKDTDYWFMCLKDKPCPIHPPSPEVKKVIDGWHEQAHSLSETHEIKIPAPSSSKEESDRFYYNRGFLDARQSTLAEVMEIVEGTRKVIPKMNFIGSVECVKVEIQNEVLADLKARLLELTTPKDDK